MAVPVAETDREKRVPFHPLYLGAVILAAFLNSSLFAIYVRRETGDGGSTEWILGAFLGLFFAAGCSLSTLPLAQWLRRQSVGERMVLFLVVNLGGLALLIWLLPFLLRLLRSFWNLQA